MFKLKICLTGIDRQSSEVFLFFNGVVFRTYFFFGEMVGLSKRSALSVALQ